MTVERLPDGTLVRRSPAPFTPEWLARHRRAAEPEREPAEAGWCPRCGYVLHNDSADCPDELEVRAAWGDK